MKRCAFYGKEAYDLVYYMALLLFKLGEKVQVYDGSRRRYLCRSVFHDCTEGSRGTFAGVDFFVVSGESVMDVVETESPKEGVLFYIADEPESHLHGFLPFFVTGNLPEELEELPGKLESCGEEGVVILRDAIRSVADADILENLYLPEWFVRENLCEIPFDWMDYQMRVQLCYELPRKIPEVSREYARVMTRLAVWMTGKEIRQVRKAYRKGRRGSR